MMDLTVKKKIDNGLPCLSVIIMSPDITEIEHSPDKQRRKNKNIYLQFLL